MGCTQNKLSRIGLRMLVGGGTGTDILCHFSLIKNVVFTCDGAILFKNERKNERERLTVNLSSSQFMLV